MAWQDRIREAAYTSPSGVRMVFDYEDVQRKVEKKTAAFDFPDAEGSYIQDLGHSARRYPLRLIFWGEDYDQDAQAFENMLLETGPGKLEHPVYGSVEVVPYGTITRRDDLKTAANQAVIEATFWETTGLVYPTSQDDPGSAVLSAVDEFNEASAEQFEGALVFENAVEPSAFRTAYEGLLGSARDGLQTVADAQDAVQQTFNDIDAAINEGLDVLIGEPLDLAFQTTLLIQAPARSAAAFSDRLSAYSDLAASITSGAGAVVTPGYDNREANEFRTRDLYVSAYVTGAVISAVNNQFETKTAAIAAAEALLDELDSAVNWRDDNFVSLGDIDTGAAFQKLHEAAILAAGYLVDISFSLKQERRVVLDRARTIVDLAAELYGSVDDQLDFLIASNDLTGSEIIELPKGREIVYYL